MRIADIIASLVVPGAFIVDRTDPSAGVRPYAELSPEHGVAIFDARPPRYPESLAIVLSLLPALELDAEPSVHVVIAEALESFYAAGLIELAAVRGWEIASVHTAQHRALPYAVVLRRSDAGARHSRAVSEYRLGRALLEQHEASEEELAARLEKSEARAAALRAELEEARSRADRAGDARALAEQRAEALAREISDLHTLRDRLESTIVQLRAQQREMEQRLEKTTKRLVTSRSALSFRVGRATKVAVREGARNPLAIGRRWIETFRGPDEMIADLKKPARVEAPKEAAQPAIVPNEVERRHFALGLPARASARPPIAAIVGPRLAVELGACATLRALTPNAWPAMIDDDPPAFVLVTDCGLAPGSAFGEFGNAQAGAFAVELKHVAVFCRARHIPIVYWDTSGAPRARGGLPRGVVVDARYSITPREEGERALAPAIAPRVFHPFTARAELPRRVVFAGRFDLRLDHRERAAFFALLRAASTRDLLVLDELAGYRGALAELGAPPAGLASETRRRPRPQFERGVLASAGIALVHHAIHASGVPPWQALRAIAAGAHVVSTPGTYDAAELGIDTGDPEPVLDAIVQRERLDSRWERAWELVLERHSLGDRLDAIARDLGAPSVSEHCSIGVLARVERNDHVRALASFVRSQRTEIAALSVGASPGLDLAPLSEVHDRVVRRGTPMHGVTHVVRWDPTMPGGVLAALRRLASSSDADAIAVESGPRASFEHRPPREGAVVAMRAERFDPDAVVPRPAAACLVYSRSRA